MPHERLKAVFLLATLKHKRAGGDFSHTETLCELVIEELRECNVACEIVRLVDHDIKPGIKSNMGRGDEWPGVLKKGSRPRSSCSQRRSGGEINPHSCSA